jgi:hypothetical protein
MFRAARKKKTSHALCGVMMPHRKEVFSRVRGLIRFALQIGEPYRRAADGGAAAQAICRSLGRILAQQYAQIGEVIQFFGRRRYTAMDSVCNFGSRPTAVRMFAEKQNQIPAKECGCITFYKGKEFQVNFRWTMKG